VIREAIDRGDKGINSLDTAYREHNIVYSYSNNLVERHAADNTLTEKARKRITAGDSTFREKAAATAIWAVMMAKTKIGMGLKTRKRRTSEYFRVKRSGVMPVLSLFGILGSIIGAVIGSVARRESPRQ